VINALIESSNFSLLPSTNTPEAEIAQPLIINTPSLSGKGQLIARCPKCYVAVWSEYGGVPIVKFVRVGTMDEPGKCPPSIHIFAGTKQDWLKLEGGGNAKVCEGYYDR
jgi:hypothetical protein